MIPITKTDVMNSGGFLSALSAKSSEYVKSIIQGTKQFDSIEGALLRNIVHTDPHLDEYFAELLFRACLPNDLANIEFIEETVFSADHDLGCQQLWPQAAVFGIGDTVSCGVAPLLLFDEHKNGKGKASSSCGEVVVNYLEANNQVTFPDSVRTVLHEVNIIDEFGNAHPQHLGNLIKTIHNVRFLFSKGSSPKDDVKDFLSPTWKRSLINGCITAVIYCLENDIDLISDPDSKKSELQKSLKEYVDKSLHKSHPNFEKARQIIASNFGSQQGVFGKAVLKSAKGPIIDANGNNVPQILILSRICFACYKCWGEKITNMIMLHFWETEFQNQINFLALFEELDKAFKNQKSVNKRTRLGVIRREILHPIEIRKKISDKNTHQTKYIRRQSPLWVINIRPTSDVFNANQATLNYINKNNNGVGLILIEDTYIGTKTLFRGEAIPSTNWAKLTHLIESIEPQCWHDPSTDPNQPAPFIINGSKAHQYVLCSRLDMDALCMLVKRCF